MRRTCIAISILLFGFVVTLGAHASTGAPLAQQQPRIPEAGAVVSEGAQQKTQKDVFSSVFEPSFLSISAIGLHSPIDFVSTTQDGKMSVPSARTNHVGWYQYGVVPGEIGSAVLAAHVTAAFSKLNRIKVGSEIYVEGKDGSSLRFIVQEKKTYALADLSPNELFNRTDAKRLTLITCAGKLTRDGSDFDHRLVVYATLAEK